MGKCWNEECGLHDTGEMGNCNNPFLADIDTCHKFKAKKEPSAESPAAASNDGVMCVAAQAYQVLEALNANALADYEYIRAMAYFKAISLGETPPDNKIILCR